MGTLHRLSQQLAAAFESQRGQLPPVPTDEGGGDLNGQPKAAAASGAGAGAGAGAGGAAVVELQEPAVAAAVAMNPAEVFGDAKTWNLLHKTDLSLKLL